MRLLFFVLFFPIIIIAQSSKKEFKGVITFEIQESITNESAFDTSLSAVVNKIDSVIISKEGINEWTSTNKPTLNLFLDPRQNNNLLNTVEYHFKDTIMVTKILKVFGSRSFRIIDKSKETYSILYAKDSSLIEKNRRYQFENRKVDLKIFKDSIKEIGGYKCFKVLYVEKENFEYNGIQLSKLYPNNRVFTEMYVTDSIESNYHPTINNKFILDKYYPLEIRYYSNLFKGKETTLKVTSLKKI